MNKPVSPKPIKIDITGLSIREIAEAALPALAARLTVFQRGGRLVHIVHEPESRPGFTSPTGASRIRALPKQLLTNELHESATWVQRHTDKSGNTHEEECNLPDAVVRTILEAGQWAHIHELRGITQWPVFSTDGRSTSVIVTNGYNRPTRYALQNIPTITLPRQPTQADAEAAARKLLDVIAEFPIKDDAGRAAWLAGILTMLTRPVISGPVPGIIFDAPAAGSGKTLLAKSISLIVTGDEPAMRAAPADNSEWHRALITVLSAGDPIVVFDNVKGRLDNGSLEAVLTGTRFADRLLRTNEDIKLPIETLFLFTANNATISRDMVRRCLHCRVIPDTDRPELRDNFRIKDLVAYIREHRCELLSAALTIPWAYGFNGSPPVEMRSLGSYEGWSDAVRRPLIWAGCADPVTTQDGLLEVVSERGDASELLDAWYALYGDKPMIAKSVLANLAQNGSEESDPRVLRLREAVEAACEDEKGNVRTPTPRLLGGALSKLKDAVLGRYRLEQLKKIGRGIPWRVVAVDGDSGESPQG